MEVWKLGLLMHSVFTGSYPFVEEDWVVTLKRVITREVRMADGIDRMAWEAIVGALAPRPEDRISAEAISVLLVEVDGGARARRLSGRRGSARGAQERPVILSPPVKIGGVRVRGRSGVPAKPN
jgi:hypothetical protein